MFQESMSLVIVSRLRMMALVVLCCLMSSFVSAQEATVEAKSEQEEAPVEKAEMEKPSADPTGTWKWEREFRGNVMRSTLVLKKAEEDKLTGTLQTLFGDGNGPGREPVKIDDGKIDGDQITFSITRSFNDNDFTVDYEGKLKDGKLSGTYTLDFGNGSREFDWDAKRSLSLEDLIGKWMVEFEMQGGNKIQSSMTLKENEEKKLAGTYHSQYFGEAPMSEIKLKDDTVSFVVEFETDNGDIEVQYAGKPIGDKMTGTITSEFGGQENKTPFEAKRETKKKEGTPAGA